VMINLDDWHDYQISHDKIVTAEYLIPLNPSKARLVREGLLYCLSAGKIVKDDVETAKKLIELVI